MRQARAFLAIIASCAVVAAGLYALTPPQPAEAANARDFNAGYIVSDEQFFNGYAMSGMDVQRFLDKRVRECGPGNRCLKLYRQNTPKMDANRYCKAMPARTSQSAAAIMYRVARACNINPKALLVLLEKEQGLVSASAPSQRRLERATGFACPDTAPCDSSFGGFFYQIYYAGRQFQRYAAHPERYRYRAGVVNRVQYHPNIACGSSGVNIRNKATAGLYNYTPYQPNAAALNNLYGTGNSCSAYGNRNFWRMWTDWFGSPTAPLPAKDVGPLVRVDNTNEHYLISGSTRYRFSSGAMAAEYSRLGKVQYVTRAWLGTKRDGGGVGRVIRASDGRTFFVDNNKRFQFASCAQMADWAYRCGGPTVGSNIVNGLMNAGKLRDIVGWERVWWRVNDGKRHEIGDTRVIGELGLSYANSWMSPGALDHLPIGPPLLAPGRGVRDEPATRSLLAGDDGTTASLDEAQTRLPTFDDFGVVSAESLDASSSEAVPLPDLLRSGGAFYILTDSGLLQVSPEQYGGAQYFSEVAAEAIAGLDIAGDVRATPHFVAEIGGSTAYLMSDSPRRAHPVDDVENVAAEAGANPEVFYGAAGFLDTVPESSSFPAGTLLRDSESDELLLTSHSTTVEVANTDVARALGFTAAPVEISTAVRGGLPPVESKIDDYGVRCAAPQVGSWGWTYELPPDLAAHWGQDYEQLPADICDQMTPAEKTLTQVVTDATGGSWLVENGERRPIESHQALRDVGYDTAQSVRVSNYLLFSLPRGEAVR